MPLIGRLRMSSTIWILIVTTGTTKVTQFMVIPFVALYMRNTTHASPEIIGLAVGTNALVGTICGYVGGWLSDRVGKKSILIAALLISAMTLFGFSLAKQTWEFFVLSGMSGITRSLFGPTSRAVISTLLPKSALNTAYAMNFLFLNLGAAIGPVIGSYLGASLSDLPFYISAAVSLVFAGLIFVVMRGSTGTEQNSKNREHFLSTLKVIFSDKQLVLFLVASALELIGYSQIDTTLPQILSNALGAREGAHLFSLVLFTNGLIIVLFQLPLAKFGEKVGAIGSLVLAHIIFAISYLSFASSHSPITYLISIIIFSAGEALILPASNVFLSTISPETRRSTYFGSSSLSKIGMFIGPWIGGVILSQFNEKLMFISMSLIVCGAIPLYFFAGEFRNTR